MHTKKSKIITGVVIVLIILVVLFFYLMLNAKNAQGDSFSLGQYLNGLAQAAMDNEAMGTSTMLEVSSTSVSAQTSPVSTAGRAVPVAKPYIRVLSPASGSSGLTVVIGGGNFDPAVNYITFGASNGQHAVNGLPDNVIASAASLNGTTLTFNVPLNGPSELQCDSTGKNCIAIPPIPLPAGAYAVTVKTNAGVSNAVYFTLVR